MAFVAFGQPVKLPKLFYAPLGRSIVAPEAMGLAPRLLFLRKIEFAA